MELVVDDPMVAVVASGRKSLHAFKGNYYVHQESELGAARQ